MKVNEIFYTIQGEGSLTGVPSIFVRLSGCNLRCQWCDTPYASYKNEGDMVSIEYILKRCSSYTMASHVVVTGGEPFIHGDLPELISGLKALGLHVTIETAGTIYAETEADLISLSPKLKNSTPIESQKWALKHEERRQNIEVLSAFIKAHTVQLKYVIQVEHEIEEVQEQLSLLPEVENAQVHLMPQALDSEAQTEIALNIVEVAKKYGYRFCYRLHTQLWGGKRGV